MLGILQNLYIQTCHQSKKKKIQIQIFTYYTLKSTNHIHCYINLYGLCIWKKYVSIKLISKYNNQFSSSINNKHFTLLSQQRPGLNCSGKTNLSSQPTHIQPHQLQACFQRIGTQSLSQKPSPLQPTLKTH